MPGRHKHTAMERGVTQFIAAVGAVLGFIGAPCGAPLHTMDTLAAESPEAQRQDSASGSDFFVTTRAIAGERSKFITYGWIGFAGGIVHWRYNDANRPVGIVASATEALQRIQAGMDKWSAACNVHFVYDGTTTQNPDLVPPAHTFDGVNVIGWTAQGYSGQTGVAGVGAVGPPWQMVEADIALNYQYNPALDKTILHELGHMLGLDHSDVNNVVMSGPPSSSYGTQGTLQPDDINGCLSLYPSPTISGTISNGATAVSGVSFCAQPSVGVSCTVSNASGAYSCTVPNGWSGVLHSPMVGGQRIPAQVFANVTGAVTRNVAATTGVPSCDLDVDNNGLFEAATDGLAILRRALGFGQASFAGLSGTCAANTTAASIHGAANTSFNAGGYNVTGGGATLATTDALVIIRTLLGLSGNAVVDGLGLSSKPGVVRTSWNDVKTWMNSNCRAGL